MTTPGAVYKNLLILGSRVNETYGASPGYIRAYDTVTGQLKWIFHTIPQPGEFGHDTWSWPKGETFGGANAWGGITIDEKRGWVFAATGSATDDFYGGFRREEICSQTASWHWTHNRQAEVALPDCSSRPLGLRQSARSRFS